MRDNASRQAYIDAITEAIDECVDDPDLFNEIVLGRSPYWHRQAEICQAVAKYECVTVDSGNSTGKTYLLAGLMLWWLYSRPGSMVFATSASQILLASVLFKEVRRAHSGSLIPLGGTVTQGLNASPQQINIDSNGWGVIGVATRGVERASGHHHRDLLVVVDEASGVESDIWEGIDSLNPAKMVVFGNPLHPDGQHARISKLGQQQNADPTIPDSQRTFFIRLPSTDSPDIELERSPRGLADAGFLRRSAAKYGRDSLWWRTHIDALRPQESTDGLLAEAWLDIASVTIRPDLPGGVKRLACDLGEGVGRDKTVVLVRDELGILAVEASSAWGLAEAAAKMAELARTYGVPDENCSWDALGIGRDLANHLHRHGLKARPYRGSKPVAGGDFTNLRTLSAWRLRQRLDPERAPDYRRPFDFQIPFAINPGPWWPDMRDELLAIKYELRGQAVKLENKEDLCVRLGHSPDYADALIQSFAPLR